MRRIRIAALVGVLFTLGLLQAPPAAATQEITIDIAIGQDLLTPTADPCPPPTIDPFVACTRIEGIGITLAAAKVWTFRMTYTKNYHGGGPGYGCEGTWSLSALDGDGLYGDLIEGGDCLWVITGGTGAYAGVTDAEPGGRYQPFHHLEVPLFLEPVPVGFGYLGTGVWTGSFHFTVA